MNVPTQARWRRTPDGARLELTLRFAQPIEKVWNAITDPDRLRRWMGIEWLGEAAPLEAGARFDDRFANADMESRGHVRVFDPPRVFEHTWFENIPPETHARRSRSVFRCPSRQRATEKTTIGGASHELGVPSRSSACGACKR